jgi:hypothetical protein
MIFKLITIHDYMGIPDISFDPKSFCVISGKNGQGKSSIIEAIRSVGGRVHDPARIRKGAEFADVVIEMDNGYVFKMRTRPKGTSWKYLDEEGHEITKGAEFIDSIVNSLSFDPIKFMYLKPAEQLKAYQAAMPLRITAQDLAFVPGSALAGADLDKHALDVIGDKKSGIYGKLYNQRTELNRTADVAMKYAEKLAESLPADAPEGNWSELYQAKSAELSTLRSESSARISAIRLDADSARQAQEEFSKEYERQENETLAGAERQLNDEIADAIAKLKAKADASFKAALDRRDSLIKSDRKRLAAELSKITATKEAALEAAKAEYVPRNEALIAEISKAKTMISEHASHEATRNLIDEQHNIELDAVDKSKQITDILGKLEKKRIELVAKSPIPGLEVVDGELFYERIPFRIVNESKRAILSAEICALSESKLSAVIIDSWEKLDQEHQEGFKKWALSTGRQYIVAQKTEGPLEIAAEKGA